MKAGDTPLGHDDRPLRVAVVGSGPSGFYAAEALLRSDCAVEIDLLERLPAPFGLVRYGVAPDHPKLKQPIQVYDNIARSEPLHFFGNVNVGSDISVAELRQNYHAILFTCGAETDRRLGIEGEALPGSHTATEFVAWYNGHPDYRDRQFDLSGKTAVIIGQGNVAADVARILAKDPDELKATDIAQHALDALTASAVERIHVIGRRGPAQAKFTPKELREFADLDHCSASVEPSALELNEASEQELAAKRNNNAKKNLELFRKFAGSPQDKPRRCSFDFLLSPVRFEGSQRVERLVLERNRLHGEPFAQSPRGTGDTVTIDCGLVFRSIGYFGVPMAGVPFDEQGGTFANREGRIVDDAGVVPGLYAAGWIKRGPTGIIGTNRADAVATVKALLDDLDRLDDGQPKPGGAGVSELLRRRSVQALSYADWQRIDQAEVERGAAVGKPREKICRIEEMLALL